MSNNARVQEVRNQEKQRIFRQQRGSGALVESNTNSLIPPLIDVGRNLRDLRAEKDLSIRSLAELSGLNVNTLSISKMESPLQASAHSNNSPVHLLFLSQIFSRRTLLRIMSRIRRRINAYRQHLHMEHWQT